MSHAAHEEVLLDGMLGIPIEEVVASSYSIEFLFTNGKVLSTASFSSRNVYSIVPIRRKAVT